MWPFYLYGRLIAVLEQGARGHGEVPWLEQYYPRGFFPLAGLREPLERHRHSVLNFLTRARTAPPALYGPPQLAGQRPGQHRRRNNLRHLGQPLPVLRRKPETRGTGPVHSQGMLRYTPRATWTNALRTPAQTGQPCRRTKASGSSAGTTTRAVTSPSTSPATTPGCPQEPSWALPNAELSLRPNKKAPQDDITAPSHL